MRLQNLPRQIYCMLSGVGVSRVVGMWFRRGAGHYVPPSENEGRSRQQCHGEVCLGRTIFVSSALGAVEGRTIPVPSPHPQNVPGLVCSSWVWVDPNSTDHPRDAKTLVVRTQRKK